MPKERSAGLLVSPMGNAEALANDEHAQLELIRQILNEDTGLSAAFDWFLHLAANPEERAMKDVAVLKRLADHYFADNADDSDGMLLERHTEPGEGDLLSESELKILQNTLITLRLGGWFPGWLACQVGTIADAKVDLHDDQYPSPLKIAGTLGLAIAEWQDKVETAKRFAEMRPDLFPTPPAEPEAVPEPVATSTKPKRQRPRQAKRRAA